jgi:hypothetical protein
MMPVVFTRPGLIAAGFQGFVTFAALRVERFAGVPAAGGAYVVLREADSVPAFLPANPGGRFKGKDPTLPPTKLQERWVPGAHVIYIGKANDLRRRLWQYGAFGAGRAVGHWGGRMVWQIADADQLVVAWRHVDAGQLPAQLESSLLDAFCMQYGSLPFANRRF